jgi:hypothetical protein
MKIIFITIPFLIFSGFPTHLDAQVVNKSKDTVKVGYSTRIFSSVNIEDAHAATNFLLDKLIKEWGREGVKPVAEMIDDLEQLKREIINNRLDLVILNTMDYLDIKEKVKLVPIFVYKYRNIILSKMLLICRKEFNFNSVKDLRNKKIIIAKTFNSDKSLSALWLQTLALKNKENYSKYYSPNISFYEKAMRCVADVFLKKADALVISEEGFEAVKDLNPQFGAELKVVLCSKPLLYSIFCYTDRINTHQTFILEELKDKLKTIHNSKTGKQFMSMFRIDSFTPYNPEYLRDTEELIIENKKLTYGKVSQ